MVKIAFYIAKHGNFIDKLIAWWTRPKFWNFFKSGKFSHVEILFDNRNNLCFSASPRENKTRWKHITDIHTSGKWVIVDVKHYNEEFENYLIYQCIGEENKPYDWLCIFLTHVIPLNIEFPNSWICSELVAKLVYVLPHANTYSPNKLYDYINSINE